MLKDKGVEERIRRFLNNHGGKIDHILERALSDDPIDSKQLLATELVAIIRYVANVDRGINESDVLLSLRVLDCLCREVIPPEIRYDPEDFMATQFVVQLPKVPRSLFFTALKCLRQFDAEYDCCEANEFGELLRTFITVEIGTIHISSQSRQVIAELTAEIDHIMELNSQDEEGATPCEQCKQYFRVLGLTPEASAEEVRKKRRAFAEVLHPDQLGGKSAEAQYAAEEQLKVVNEACDHILQCSAEAKVDCSTSAVGENVAADEEERTTFDGHMIRTSNLSQLEWLADAERPGAAATSVTSATTYEQEPAVATESMPLGTAAPEREEERPTSSSSMTVWRYTKVGLRTVWRCTKLIIVLALALLVAALMFMGLVASLTEYWEGEAGRGRGEEGHGALGIDSLFGVLNTVMWLPRHVWQGIIIIVSVLTIVAFAAGQWLVQVGKENWTVTLTLASVIGSAIVVCTFLRERRAELKLSGEEGQPTTRSWVAGLVVVILAGCGFMWSEHLSSSGPSQLKSEYSIDGEPSGSGSKNSDPAIPPMATTVRSEIEDVASRSDALPPVAVSLSGEWVLINRTGKVVVKLANVNRVEQFSEGIATFSVAVRDPNPDIAENDLFKYQRRYGYIDPNGNILLSPGFTSAGRFREGYAVVALGETSPYYRGASDVTGTRNFVDRAGHLLLAAPADAFDCCSDDQGFTSGLAPILADGGWVFVDHDGDTAIPTPFKMADSFSSGLAAVATRIQDGGKLVDCWGYINRKGKMVIPAAYDYAGRFAEGLAAVRAHGTAGYINTAGDFVIRFANPPLMMGEFSGGVAIVSWGSKYGAIDRAGNVVIQPNYDMLSPFMMGVAIARIGSFRAKGSTGAIAKNGSVIIPLKYDEIVRPRDGGMLLGCTLEEDNAKSRASTCRKIDIFDTTGKQIGQLGS
jgi:hypothetical protein